MKTLESSAMEPEAMECGDDSGRNDVPHPPGDTPSEKRWHQAARSQRLVQQIVARRRAAQRFLKARAHVYQMRNQVLQQAYERW